MLPRSTLDGCQDLMLAGRRAIGWEKKRCEQFNDVKEACVVWRPTSVNQCVCNHAQPLRTGQPCDNHSNQQRISYTNQRPVATSQHDTTAVRAVHNWLTPEHTCTHASTHSRTRQVNDWAEHTACLHSLPQSP
ncbi:hypothetical protein RRG08_060963 [Elysia crispata]|uniref:Uncharacterized protein n=1 Tax=Elysia crispata TaxID=231223 RepID=A0AAE1E650_9GAST|nr:hypothetical protein RRG08_060963 [Elysia crispata]